MSDRTEVLMRSLTESGLTIGIAESLTGGALCAELIRPAGASAVVLGGVVAYATSVKARVLHVDAELLASEGAVHPRVAAQMAAGIRDAVADESERVDIGVSTTGVAGPGADGGHEPGTVYIAVDSEQGTAVRALKLSGDRDAVRAASVTAAIEFICEVVLHAGATRE